VNVKPMEQQFDEVMCLTASLMLRKLAAYPRQNSLATGLREYGRLDGSSSLLFCTEIAEEPGITGVRGEICVCDGCIM
jgi:TnpA family transposase